MAFTGYKIRITGIQDGYMRAGEKNLRKNLKNPLTNGRECGIILFVEKKVRNAAMAQLVERILGKDEVISSTLISSSSIGNCRESRNSHTYMPAWRNRQTRRTQNPLVAISCGFDPRRRHQQGRVRPCTRTSRSLTVRCFSFYPADTAPPSPAIRRVASNSTSRSVEVRARDYFCGHF